MKAVHGAPVSRRTNKNRPQDPAPRASSMATLTPAGSPKTDMHNDPKMSGTEQISIVAAECPCM